MPERVERHVRSALGRLHDGSRYVRHGAGVDHSQRAHRPGRSASASAETSTATTRAPSATATWTADSPTPPQPWTATHSPGCTRALMDDGTEGSRVAAAEAGRDGERQLGRQRDEIDVGCLEGDELRERAPVREPGLRLVAADLLLAREHSGQ